MSNRLVIHRIFFILLFTLFLLFLTSANAANKAVIDDFSADTVQGRLWEENAERIQLNSTNENLEMSLGTDNQYAGTTVKLNIANPSTVNTLRTDVTITSTSGPSSDSELFAGITGIFYSTMPADPNSALGDIFVAFSLVQRNNGTLEANWFASQSGDDDFTSENEIFLNSADLSPASPLQIGTTYRLTIIYDGANDFDFEIHDTGGTLLASDSYTGPARMSAPRFENRRLRNAIFRGSSENTTLSVQSVYDNVFVNGVSYDDFSGSEIDSTKWLDIARVREVTGGKLKMENQGFGGTDTLRTHLLDNTANYFSAKVMLDSSSSNIPVGSSGRARISGIFYNQTIDEFNGDMYNGFLGDVFIQVTLRIKTDGTLEAFAAVDASLDANFDTFQSVAFHTFTTPISFDTEYELSIQIRFDNNTLVLGLDNEKFVHNITTIISAASPESAFFGSRQLVTRVQDGPGYIGATFDDVITDNGPVNGDMDEDTLSDVMVRNSTTNKWYGYQLDGNTVKSSSSVSLTDNADWQPIDRSDYDGGGSSDMLLRNQSNNRWYIYNIAGTDTYGGGPVNMTTNPAWQVIDILQLRFGVGVLMRNQTSNTWYFYELGGNSIQFSYPLPMTTNADWQPESVSDFNGDNFPDVLLRNQVSNNWYLYQLEGEFVAKQAAIAMTSNADWQPVSFKDFNFDGKSDVLMRNATNNKWYLYLLNGTSIISGSSVNMTSNPDWQPVSFADFNFDGKPDVLMRNATTNKWYLYQLDGNQIIAGGSVNMTSNADWQPVSFADYNGDGKTDVLMRNTTTNKWYQYQLDGNSIVSGKSVPLTSNAAWVPVPN